MSGLDEREKAFEKKFAHEQELEFAVEARAAKLFGIWAAERQGLKGDTAEAYAKNLVVANMDEAGFEDVLRPVRADFAAKGLKIDEAEIMRALADSVQAAKEQIRKSS